MKMDKKYRNWPPEASEFCYKGAISDLLSILLTSILNVEKESCRKAANLINSLCQDIVYAENRWKRMKKITTKHVSLV